MFFEMDFSHFSFLDEAKNDWQAAVNLYNSGLYSQAVYFLQQSVEKSSKFWGLSLRFVSYDDLKKLGHNPHKVFKKLFGEAVLLGMGNKEGFELLESNVNRLPSVDERVHRIGSKLKAELNFNYIKIKEGQTAMDALRDCFMEAENLDIVGYLEGLRGKPEWEKKCIGMVNKINKESRYITLQMGLSFLVWGLESNSRYPDYNEGTVPSDLYSKDTELVKALPFFTEVQGVCIDILDEVCRLRE